MDTSEELIQEEREEPIITLLQANEAVKSIKADRLCCQVFVNSCLEEIEHYKALIRAEEEKYAQKHQPILLLLREWLRTETGIKKAKCSESVKLGDGTIRVTYPAQMLKPDEARLSQLLADTEFVEKKPVLKWAEYKKVLKIQDGNVVNTKTGEIVDGVWVAETDEKVTIE